MRPTRDEILMGHAKLTALRSTCSRASVGVVIAREGRVLVTGYNGAPAHMDHCDHTCDCGGNSLDVTLHRPSCNALIPCKISVHAEANAIAFAARYGIALEGAEMHTTYTACVPCAQLIINSGVIRVVALEQYRDPAGQVLLEKAGIALA